MIPTHHVETDVADEDVVRGGDVVVGLVAVGGVSRAETTLAAQVRAHDPRIVHVQLDEGIRRHTGGVGVVVQVGHVKWWCWIQFSSSLDQSEKHKGGTHCDGAVIPRATGLSKPSSPRGSAPLAQSPSRRSTPSQVGCIQWYTHRFVTCEVLDACGW